MNAVLPVEILVKVLLGLDSIELVRALHVCRFWNDVIQDDPCLRRSCFKHPSLFYYDEGCEPTFTGDLSSTSIRFHPAITRISYRMGDSISAVRVCNYDVNGDFPSLIDLPIQNDFATVPAVTSLRVEILPEENMMLRKKSGLRGITCLISNTNGITLKDIFSNIAEETSQFCDLVTYASGGLCSQRIRASLTYLRKAEILGKQKSYAGVKDTTVENGIVNVILETVM